MQSLFALRCAILTLAVLIGSAALAEDLLVQVPPDAMGYVVVHNLQMADAKVRKLANSVQYGIPHPLAFLQSVTGVVGGLRADGDAMLVLLGDSNGAGPVEYCLWLPVANYDELIRSLHANATGELAAATVAGEDVLIARRGDWALIMDPDQRERLKELATVAPTPTPAAPPLWKDWIEANDITAIVLRPGISRLVALLNDGDDARDDDSPFSALAPDNRPSLTGVTPPRNSVGVVSRVEAEVRKWAAAAPEIAQLLEQVPAVGIGARLDLQANAIAGIRVSLEKLEVNPLGPAESRPGELPPSIYRGGGFAVNAAGQVPPSLLATLASAYVRRTAVDMLIEERTVLSEPALKELEAAVESAAKEVHGIEFLSQPGAEPQPVYTNDYVGLRVSSASTFMEQAREVMRLWNKANRDAKGDTRLVFDYEETKVAERLAQQYSLDVAALDGGPAAPEMRQIMEKLFGAGGKLRAWVVPVDEHTVLLATGTSEQVTAAAKTLAEQKPIDWKDDATSASNALLPAESDWRVFADVHRYSQWRQREAAAMTDVPVIGGPLVREFPASPPMAAAGGVKNSELWLDVAVPLAALKAATAHFTHGIRAPMQLRSRTAPPAPLPVEAPK